ncbi:MAG: tetratricopeptide repeat protein [Candidatus Brocadia sp.]|nr:tetratricopeptide repeat protein [Candidatus Brocadia sp.]
MKIMKTPNLPILILILVASSQLIYLNSLSNQFVYDDEFTIVNNHFIKTWSNLPLLFNQEYFRFSGELSYRPVVTLTYFFDFALWKLNPFGFHFSNLLLHTINSVLLFFLFMQVFKNRMTSFTAVLLFLSHPVLSETVNAVSYREDLLGATFFIAAFLLYLTSCKDERRFSPLSFASLACYFFGVFSKEMAVTLPFFIFLYDIIFTKKPNLRYKFIHYYPGYIFVAAFYLVIRFVILHNPVESHVAYPGDSIFVNFLTMSKVLASYIVLFLSPFNLCADYVVPSSSSLLDISFILSFLLLFTTAVIAYRMFFYSKIAFFAILWFFISLLPVLNIVPIENIMAERYLYLPILGFCMLGGNLFMLHDNKFGSFDKPRRVHDGCNQAQNKDQVSGVRNPAPYVYPPYFAKNLVQKKGLLAWNAIAFSVLIFVLISFSITTIRRNNIWINQMVLWTDTAKRSPNSFKTHNNLGNMYRDTGRLDEAVAEFKHALTLYDGSMDAHNNLGVTYRKKGMLDEAMLEYQKVLRLNPRYPYAHNNLGVLYAKSNLLDLAIDEFHNAIASKPDYSDAHNNLGATYIRKGLHEKAIQACLEAIKYNDRYKDAYYNLSAAYFNTKQLDKALEASRMALSIDPNHWNAQEIFHLICEQKGLAEKK